MKYNREIKIRGDTYYKTHMKCFNEAKCVNCIMATDNISGVYCDHWNICDQVKDLREELNMNLLKLKVQYL